MGGIKPFVKQVKQHCVVVGLVHNGLNVKKYMYGTCDEQVHESAQATRTQNCLCHQENISF